MVAVDEKAKNTLKSPILMKIEPGFSLSDARLYRLTIILMKLDRTSVRVHFQSEFAKSRVRKVH